jgi:uncharacterized protein (DUF342 family)
VGSRFPIAAFRPGMTLKAALLHDGGQLLPAGATVTDRHLQQMASWGIEEVETEQTFASLDQLVRTEGGAEVMDLAALGLEPKVDRRLPPGRFSEDGKTYIVEETLLAEKEPWIFDENVHVRGQVGEKAVLKSLGSIQIDGTVGPGAVLSAGGNLAVLGAVVGAAETAVRLDAENVRLAVAHFAEIEARHALQAASLHYCRARAGGDVTVTDAENGILSGEIEAGGVIRAAVARGESDRFAVLRVPLQRHKQLFLAMTRLEQGIAQKAEEMARLEKVMEVIRILGEKVVALPPEKKQELALQSRRYMELKGEMTEMNATRDRIRDELENEEITFEACPIQLEKLMPGVEIVLGAASLKLNSRLAATAYYSKSGRIRAVSRS